MFFISSPLYNCFHTHVIRITELYRLHLDRISLHGIAAINKTRRRVSHQQARYQRWHGLGFRWHSSVAVYKLLIDLLIS